MMVNKIDEFLKKHENLEGTVTNAYGEAVYLGSATDIKRTKYDYKVRWNVPENFEHISPFDKMILHNGKRIFGILNMPPFRLDGYTKFMVTVK